MKKIIIAVIVVILVIIGVYFWYQNSSNVNAPTDQGEITDTTNPIGGDQTGSTNDEDDGQIVIGKSVQGRDIIAYNFSDEYSASTSVTADDTDTEESDDDVELLFVGGIHGGYEWNTSLVAYQMMDYLTENPSVIPEDVNVTVIPVLNPDGLSKVLSASASTSLNGRCTASDVATSDEILISGRFNANNVDLNRNFDCDWQSVGKWQNKDVSGGTAAFSEPESLALKNYVEANEPDAVVVWYSAAGGVFASSCHNGVSTETRTLTNTFAKASGYKAYESFSFYEITGDMVNWLAKKEIPAISILLTNHTDTEWTKNRSGIEAVLKHYAK